MEGVGHLASKRACLDDGELETDGCQERNSTIFVLIIACFKRSVLVSKLHLTFKSWNITLPLSEKKAFRKDGCVCVCLRVCVCGRVCVFQKQWVFRGCVSAWGCLKPGRHFRVISTQASQNKMYSPPPEDVGAQKSNPTAPI